MGWYVYGAASLGKYMLCELIIKRAKVAMMQLHLVGYTVCL